MCLDLIFENKKYNVRVYGITGDCPALKKILNFIGHNGYHCCWFCYLRGEHLNGKRQYHYRRSVNPRSRQRYREESNKAQRTSARVNGHLGRSIIQDLVDIPLPDSIIIRTRESHYS
jgi:hypothetical protein